MSIKPELKIIADHLRSSSFLIADGILPSNEGRGYVLRRIMRRAMRQLHKLGAKEVSMYKLVDALIDEMGTAYPELTRARDLIIESLKNEEEKFRETLEKGLKILDESLVEVTSKEKFSGKIAFKLYDTFGFPLDLTQDILKEKNIEINIEEFDSEMKEQRQRAKAHWKGSGEVADDKVFFELKEKFGATIFTGYESLETKARILDTYPNFIILDKTPFYATSGGQRGDDGKIGNIAISETKKFAGGLFAHFFSDQKCDLKVGDEVVAQVNPKTRKAREQNHSATHLMHKVLKDNLGNSISQKGSNVDAASFTFDFNFNRAMKAEEIQKVEDLVNERIQAKSLVNTELMDLEKARESGAEALFGEKYDAKVRVVKMADSIELCGGTHVKDVADIKIFKIISEKSIASGIRRIEAKTGAAAQKYLAEKAQNLQNLLVELAQKIETRNIEISELGGNQQDSQSQTDLSSLEDTLKKQEKEIARLKKSKLLSNLDDLKAEEIGGGLVIAHSFDDIEAKDLRDIANELTKKSDLVVLFASKNGKVSLCISVAAKALDKFNATKLIKPLVEVIGGRGGGGKPEFAMGGGDNKEAIPQAIESLKTLIS
jgi:alanyl-tRNA synthetase